MRGGDAPFNAAIFRRLVGMTSADDNTAGSRDIDEEQLTAIRNFVLMNTSALLVMAGIAGDYREGVAKAREALDNGTARKTLDHIVQLSQQEV